MSENAEPGAGPGAGPNAEPGASRSGAAARKPPGLLRLVADLGPAILFFLAWRHADKSGIPDWAMAASAGMPILFATLAFLPAAVAGFALTFAVERRVSPIGVFSFAMIAVFSGLALWLKDDVFVKMRPTLVYGLIGALLLGALALRRNLLKAAFDGALNLPDAHWRGLTLRAGLMYLGLSAANEAVWRLLPEPTWVLWNTWGDASVNLVFWVVNLIWLARHMTDAEGRPLAG